MTGTKSSYIKLSLSQSVSQLGSFFTTFAISWIIVEASKSSKLIAAYLSYSLLLYAVFSPIAGKILDIFPRKKILLLSDCAGFVCLVLLSLCESLNIAGLWVYFSATFFTHLAGTVVMVGTQSVMGDFGSGKDIAKAQATFETSRRLFMVFAPVLAGFLVYSCPRWIIFVIDSITYVVSFWGVLNFLPESELQKNPKKHGFIKTIFSEIQWNKNLLRLIILVIIINLLYAPVMLMWPIIAEKLAAGSVLMGILSGSFVCGSILGGMWIIKLKNIDLWRQSLKSLFIIFAGFLLLLSGRITHPYFLVFPACVLGLGFGSVSGPIMSMLHANIPANTKGSFFGWLGFVGQIGQPPTVMASGLLVQRLGIWSFISSMALFTVLICAVFSLGKRDTSINPKLT